MSSNPQPPRCGKCAACLEVTRVSRIAAPNPPFTHGTDESVQVWNTTLLQNMCETWTPQQKVEFFERCEAFSESIRPPQAILDEMRIKVGLETP